MCIYVEREREKENIMLMLWDFIMGRFNEWMKEWLIIINERIVR